MTIERRTAFLEALVAAWPEPVVVFDREGRIVSVEGDDGNRHRWQALVGSTLHDVLVAPMADRFLGKVRSAFASSTPITLQYEIRRADVRTDHAVAVPDRRSFEARLAVLPADEVGGRYVAWFAREVTERQLIAEKWERQRVELEGLAWTDPLTGLRNRRSFLEVARHDLARHRRTGAPAVLAMIDLDLFKSVNDTGGHAAGDAVLVAIGRAIAATAKRTSDVVGRLGGEEFAVMMADTDLEGALLVVGRMREAIRSTSVLHDGRRFAVTASVGLTPLEPSDADLAEALRRADEALYAAKRAGRDRVRTVVKVAGASPVPAAAGVQSSVNR